MFVSDQDLVDDEQLGARLKDWVCRTNIATKASGVPTFVLDGSHRLPCIFRRPGSNSSATFKNGQIFRIDSIAPRRQHSVGGVELFATLFPVILTTVQEVHSISLPLLKATQVFKGLGDWLDMSVFNHTDDFRQQAAQHAQDKRDIERLPSIETTRASTAWGAW